MELKKITARYVITLLLMIFSFNAEALEVYALDPGHTFATWHVSHFGFSTLTGKFFATGTLVLNDVNQQKAKVNVEINMRELSTGLPKLDDILKGADFFDVQRFPKATFVSRKVQLIGKDKARVYGILTIRGQSKPIVLTMQLTRIGTHPFYKKKAVGFKGTTSFKRSAFGISKYVPDVGDEVNVEIESEALLHALY